jgi:predicted  nucleic acid-binding Zn-ribbon protein
MQVIETLNSKISTTTSEIQATQAQLEKHRNEGNFEKELFAQTRLNALQDVLKRYDEELATAQTQAAQEQAQQEREALEAKLVMTAKEADDLHAQIIAEEKRCDDFVAKSQAKANALLEQHWQKRDAYRQLIRHLGFNDIEQLEALNETLERLGVRSSTVRLCSLLRREAWHETSTGPFSQAEARNMRGNMR